MLDFAYAGNEIWVARIGSKNASMTTYGPGQCIDDGTFIHQSKNEDSTNKAGRENRTCEGGPGVKGLSIGPSA